MSDKLTDRLLGRYKVGPDGLYGTRDFSGFIPPICKEAADRIIELESALENALASMRRAIQGDHELSDIGSAIEAETVLLSK